MRAIVARRLRKQAVAQCDPNRSGRMARVKGSITLMYIANSFQRIYRQLKKAYKKEV